MKLQHRRLVFSLLILASSLMFVPATCRAQLLPPGDFNGKSLEEWTLDWGEWAIATDLGGQTLPDTVDGVRYLPPLPNIEGDFVANLSIQQGMPVVFSPFYVYGERYEDGSEDSPSAIDDFMLFETATIRTIFDGSVVLEGLASDFPERKSSVRVFSEPIPYVEPQDRGGINAVAAIFEVGIGTIFDNLALGEHTIRNEVDSAFFGEFAITYNITVVPEPASVIALGIGALGLVGCGRRRRSRSVG